MALLRVTLRVTARLVMLEGTLPPVEILELSDSLLACGAGSRLEALHPSQLPPASEGPTRLPSHAASDACRAIASDSFADSLLHSPPPLQPPAGGTASSSDVAPLLADAFVAAGKALYNVLDAAAPPADADVAASSSSTATPAATTASAATAAALLRFLRGCVLAAPVLRREIPPTLARRVLIQVASS